MKKTMMMMAILLTAAPALAFDAASTADVLSRMSAKQRKNVTEAIKTVAFYSKKENLAIGGSKQARAKGLNTLKSELDQVGKQFAEMTRNTNLFNPVAVGTRVSVYFAYERDFDAAAADVKAAIAAHNSGDIAKVNQLVAPYADSLEKAGK